MPIIVSRKTTGMPMVKIDYLNTISFTAVLLCLSVFFLIQHVMPSEASGEERKGIVVWKLEKKSGVSDDDIDSISGFITSEVEINSGKKVVSDADIKTILGGEEKKQRCGVDGTSCIAEIGAALGVPEAVSGDLGRMGDYWILNLRRINVREAEVIKRVARQIKGDVNILIESIPPAVAELFGKKPPPPPVVKEVAKEPKKEKKPEEPAGKKRGMSVLEKAAYGTFFPGVALIGLGGVAQWRMNSALQDYNAGDKGAESKHSMWKGVSATGYAIGGAAMAAGISLWVTDALIGEKNGEEEQALNFTMEPTEDGFVACLRGRW